MLRNCIITLFLFSSTALANAGTSQCHDLFSGKYNTVSASDFDNRIKNLAEMFLQFDSDPAKKAQQTAYFNNELSKLQQFSAEAKNQLKLKIAELKADAEVNQNRKEREDKTKKENRQKIISQHQPVNIQEQMVFHSITPGKYLRGEIREEASLVETEITKPFAMMATQVTQMMYSQIKFAAGERDPEKINPAENIKGSDSTIVEIGGMQISMKKYHPVESVSRDEIQVFINELNSLSNSNDPANKALLEKLIPGHQKGDVYDLPTEAEWEFVMTNRGRANLKFFDREDFDQVEDYAWISSNADDTTHPVAIKLPRIIDGKEFYDLEGNVQELTKGVLEQELASGKDPQGPPPASKGNAYATRGGSIDLSHFVTAKGRRNYLVQHETDSSVGFRLIRIRP